MLVKIGFYALGLPHASTLESLAENAQGPISMDYYIENA